jgi:hypothetical protein
MASRQFQPHGIAWIGKGWYVADRENSRIQLFTPDGTFLSEWTDVARPCQVFIDNAGNVLWPRLGFRAGMRPGAPPHPPPTHRVARVTIFDRPDGQLRSRWGGGQNPCAPEIFARMESGRFAR